MGPSVKPAGVRSLADDKRGAFGEVFEASRPYVGAGAADSARDLLNSLLDRAWVGDSHLPALAGAIVSPAAGMFVEGFTTGHAVKGHRDSLAVFLDPLCLTFVVAGEHAA